MRRESRVLITATALVLSVLAGRDAAAQAGPPPSGPGRAGGQRNAPPTAPPPGSPRAVAEVQEVLDSRVLTLAQKELRMSDEQYLQFFRPMRNLQAVRRGHQMQRTRLLMALRRMTNPQNDNPPTDVDLDARVKELSDLEAQMSQDERRALLAVDATLTPFQRARFRIFEEQMEQQKLRMLTQAMKAPAPKVPVPKPPKH